MQGKSTRPFNVWNILFFVLGLALLAALLTQVNFSALMRLVTGIQPAYFLLGGILYLLKTCLRAYRFQLLNRHCNPSFFDMLRLVLASSLASQILPLKLGEFSYIYLLKRSTNASISQGLSSLLIARLFDLLAIALLFILFTVTLGSSELNQLSIYFNAILSFVALLLGVILVIMIGSRSTQRLLDWSIGLLPARIQNNTVLGKLRSALQSLIDALTRYQPREYGAWGILAGLEWFVNYGVFFILMLGIGMNVPFYATVVCVTFAALASVLPLNSFGNFGTQEAGWAAGLLLMGYPRESAIASGFATHLLTLAYMIVLGGLSWLTYLLPPRPAAAQE